MTPEELAEHVRDVHQVGPEGRTHDQLMSDHAEDHASIISIQKGLANHEHDDIWQCDGWDFVGTEAECEQHVQQQDNGEGHAGAFTGCWGAYSLGGAYFLMHHLDDRHPMDVAIVPAARELLRKYDGRQN